MPNLLLQRSRIPVSIGAGRTKLLAKTASRLAKPGGIRIIDPSTEVALRPHLRLDQLWGIGARTQRKLATHGIRTLGQLSGYDIAQLCEIVGTQTGRKLAAIATGREDTTVRAPRPRRSLCTQTTLPTHEPSDLTAILDTLTHAPWRSGCTQQGAGAAASPSSWTLPP